VLGDGRIHAAWRADNDRRSALAARGSRNRTARGIDFTKRVGDNA
jgi:hypothetical protein